MKLAILGSAFFAAIFVTTPAFAECYVDRYHFNYGSDTSTIMTVSPATVCGTQQYHRGTIVNDLHIQLPAHHGTAWVEGLNWWGYKSKPGFTGQDSFVVSVNSDKGTSLINVTVNVK
jgi:hypothetical protein